jgi:MSHA biogenesis protein MshP
MTRGRAQRGFLVIAAVFLVVVLAGLVAYLATVSSTSQAASAADLNSSRAYQAARAGIEWAAYQILESGGGFCSGGTGTQTLTFGSTATLTSFRTEIGCTSTGPYTEGATSTLRTYAVTAVACNDSACPSATASATYVERKLTLTITK